METIPQRQRESQDLSTPGEQDPGEGDCICLWFRQGDRCAEVFYHFSILTEHVKHYKGLCWFVEMVNNVFPLNKPASVYFYLH